MDLSELKQRPRRNRRSAATRDLIRETELHAADFIYPLFIHEGSENQNIEAMPGCTRWSPEGLLREAEEVIKLGIPGVVLFPCLDDSLKTSDAAECYNDQGLVPRSIAALKAAYPELLVFTDVALDPYSSDGHDGLVQADESGVKILNDETINTLCQQALCHARAGADYVAPSDMMDGRVRAIREALDNDGFQETGILSYAAKYASAFYGPFRGALDSAPKAGDKKTYQMDPANSREALREARLDIEEGADIIMVKPAGAYLDIISKLKGELDTPLAAYQVSGEYLMVEAAAASGWIDRPAAILESLLSIKRAGANFILSYYAKEAANLL